MASHVEFVGVEPRVLDLKDFHAIYIQAKRWGSICYGRVLPALRFGSASVYTRRFLGLGSPAISGSGVCWGIGLFYVFVWNVLVNRIAPAQEFIIVLRVNVRRINLFPTWLSLWRTGE